MTPGEVETDPLVRLASTLSSRPAELVAAVRLAAGSALAEILDAPERLRALTVTTFLTDRRPIGPATPVELRSPTLTALADRVAALPRLDRAVLVLVDVEHLTRAETAGLVDRPVATVSQTLDRAAAALDADPYELAAVWQTLAWRDLDPAEIRRAEVRLGHQRRTRTRRRALVVAGVALLVAASIVPGAISRLTPDQVWLRGHREWVLSYRLPAPAGWEIDSRTVAADVETTELKQTVASPGHCQIVVGQPLTDDPTREPGRTVVVNGRTARLTTVSDHAVIAWSLGPDATATVTCSRVSDAAGLVTTLARRMDFTPEPILLPYRLGVIPSHFHVDQVVVRPLQGESTADLWADAALPNSVPIAVTQSSLTEGADSADDLWTLSGDASVMATTCQLVDQASVCVGVAGPGAVDSPLEQTRTSRRLRMIMDQTTMASSGADRSTWFDARTALPAS